MHIKYHIALMYAVEMNFTFKVGSREMMGCRNRNIGLTCPPPPEDRFGTRSARLHDFLTN